jgi:hypothetical protein
MNLHAGFNPCPSGAGHGFYLILGNQGIYEPEGRRMEFDLSPERAWLSHFFAEK